MGSYSFEEAFYEFVEKRLNDVLSNKDKYYYKQLEELLNTLDKELQTTIKEENDIDRLKDIFFKILREQNHLSYVAGLSDSNLLSIKLSKC
ncbi:hypothetical protein [Niallia sp.]|uniref:hypothetical protein n=1 Tax=Niallia sp. TaxID=2837523 RepID=UPI0028A06FD0|nr:hypothetical protein [Niallia sp.]